MKKILLVTIFILASVHLFAYISTSQNHWRWRKDDGSERSATWLTDTNVAITINSYDAIRLRIEVDNGPWLNGSFQCSLVYADADSFRLEINSGNDNDFVLAGTSRYVSNGEATTAQLSFDSSFTAGEIFVSGGGQFITLDTGRHSEYEWCIKPTKHIKNNTTYRFKINGLRFYKSFPQLTTAAVLPINLYDFAVSAMGKFVKLSWTTSSEQNNDHFDIERSADGKTNWKSITTVKGSGTTVQAHTYTAYDDAPLNGKNLYRINNSRQMENGTYLRQDMYRCTEQSLS